MENQHLNVFAVQYTSNCNSVISSYTGQLKCVDLGHFSNVHPSNVDSLKVPKRLGIRLSNQANVLVGIASACKFTLYWTH